MFRNRWDDSACPYMLCRGSSEPVEFAGKESASHKKRSLGHAPAHTSASEYNPERGSRQSPHEGCLADARSWACATCSASMGAV